MLFAIRFRIAQSAVTRLEKISKAPTNSNRAILHYQCSVERSFARSLYFHKMYLYSQRCIAHAHKVVEFFVFRVKLPFAQSESSLVCLYSLLKTIFSLGCPVVANAWIFFADTHNQMQYSASASASGTVILLLLFLCHPLPLLSAVK